MNSKNRKILIIILIGLVLSALAFYGTYKFLTPQRVTMYLFNDNYSAGEVVTAEMLTPVSVDAKIMVSGKSEDTASTFVTGQDIKELLKKSDALRMDVATGMPLTRALLSAAGGSSIEQTMENNKIAITVPVSGITGVSNDLKQGSRVNIYTIDAESTAAVLVLQNMTVLETTVEGDGTLTAATVECDQNQALQLAYYSTQSSIYFGLVNGSGYQAVDGTPSFKPNAGGQK